jgi:hypothetical protein
MRTSTNNNVAAAVPPGCYRPGRHHAATSIAILDEDVGKGPSFVILAKSERDPGGPS